MVPLVDGLVERHCSRDEISFTGRSTRFHPDIIYVSCGCRYICLFSSRFLRERVSEIFPRQLQHILLHLLLVDVSHNRECHLLWDELLGRESSELITGDSLHGSHSSENLSAQRVTLEKHFLETVVYVFRRSVLV